MKRNRNLGSPFNELAPEYDSWFDGEGKLIFSTEVQAFKMILPTLPKPWIEIGVGSGRFARALGIETGIDPSIELIKMARRRGINVVQGRGEQQLFDKETFGTVFLIVTLCFLDSPLKVLKETNRILAPGGKVVLGLVLRDSPWGQVYQQEKDEGHHFYKFANFYSHDETIGLLGQSGFMTERTISTLFQRPGKVQNPEEPREGYSPGAGFTIIVADK